MTSAAGGSASLDYAPDGHRPDAQRLSPTEAITQLETDTEVLMVAGSLLLFALGTALFGIAHLPDLRGSAYVDPHGLKSTACPVDTEHTRMAHTSLGSFLIHLN